MRLTLVGLGFVLLANASVAMAASPNCIIADTFKSSSGEACKYVETVIPIQSTRHSKDVLDLTTDVVVDGFSAIPGVGYVIENAYAAEDNGTGVVTIKPPKEFANYVHCNHAAFALQGGPGGPSVNNAYGSWRKVTDTYGQYVFHIKRKGYYKGRSWFNGQIIWIAVHPEYRSQAEKEHVCGPAPDK